MKPATCRATLLCLLLISLASGCATMTPSWMARRTGKTTQANKEVTLTAGFPRLGPIRIPKPGAKAARAREESRKSSSIKSRAEETRQASREMEKSPRLEEGIWSSDVRAPQISQSDMSEDSTTPELTSFDQTTQALIRSELRDATPEEREQWIQDLKGVSADMVPKILGIRRAALNSNIDQSRSAISPTAALSRNSSEVENISLPSAGLGTNNPWKANYAPPPVGSEIRSNSQGFDSKESDSRLSGPAFPSMSSNQTMTQNAASPEQLAAQVLASTSSVGLPTAGQNPMLSGMNPAQSMGMLTNNSTPGMSYGNQGMIPVTAQMQMNHYSGGLPTTPQTGTVTPGGVYQLSPQLTSGNPNQMSPASNGQMMQMNGSGTLGQQYPTNPVTSVAFNNSLQNQTNTALPQAPQNPNGWTNGNLPNYSTLPTAVHSPIWQQHLQGLIAAAEAETAQLTPGTTEQEKQRYIEAHVQLRQLYLMAGQEQRALAHIPGVDPADQEFWQQVMWGTTNYFDIRQIPSASDRATQTVAQFQAASNRLREKAHLELRGLNFCNQIYGFGDVEKFQGGNEFAPGTQVLVYAEVSNFMSELAADGRYHSKLKPSYEILRPGAQGQLIEQKNVAPIEDICNSHRQDFYFYIKLAIPDQMAQGPYILRLTVEDELSHKLATQTLNFTVK